MQRLVFYLSYAARNLRRGLRWTTFAVFCIAVGVATVVALRTLGLAIGDSLIDNVRSNNHGDITVEPYGSGQTLFPSFFGGRENPTTFTQSEVDATKNWAQENNAQVSFYFRTGNLQVTAANYVSVGRPQFINVLLIDPATFPPTGDITAMNPAGVPLSKLFTGGNDIVISQNLADSQGIKVGDTVRVSDTTDPYTVRGIVSTATEGSITNPFAAFFGFAYLDEAQAAKFQLPKLPNMISLTLPPGMDINAAASKLGDVLPGNYSTVPDLLQQNQQISDILGRFIVVMGLGALLLGGVGIINTMLVMVGRRTEEIAALKTFGLKGRQVGALFLAEAFLLGVIGSIVGCVLGVILSIGVNQYGAAFLQQPLPWRIYPEALLYGIGLGVVVTLVFGILPVLTAIRIRPAIILRPNETHLPRVGILQSLLALALVVVVIGFIAGKIIGDLDLGRVTVSGVTIGIIGVALTLLILGFLVCVLWVVVWLISHLPSFGSVDLRLAIRNLTSRRIRTATTLLALSAGMFALSSITFVGEGTREILQFQLSQNLGGNVLVFPTLGLVSQPLAQGMLTAQLSGVQGIQNNTRIALYNATLLTVDGQAPPENELGFAAPGRNRSGTTGRRPFNITIQVRQTSAPETPQTMIAGRDLTADDQGKDVLVVTEDWAQSVGANLGSMLTMYSGGVQKTFQIVGISQAQGRVAFGKVFAPPGSLSGSADIQFNILQVEPADLNAVLLKLSENPLVFALDISFIDSLLSRIINEFSAIPTVVGLLSLLAAAVAMANTVSLQTLERRRQIGVLKAVGLKGRRVLLIMLLENTLIGLLGGLLGLGLSALIVSGMTQAGTGIAIPVPTNAVPIAVALVIASVLIAWASTFLSASAAIREHVANVLRYD